MKRTAVILASLVASGVMAMGQDSLQLHLFRKLQPINSPDFTPAYTDISVLHVPWLEGSEVLAGYEYRKDNNSALTENGTGLSLGRFEAASLLRIGKGAVEGGVSYQKGSKKKVLWNTSSDYDLLYPYIMADTVGGNLDTEQYRFYGRYAGDIGNGWEYGVAGSYRALHEFRQTDPRPRNITSDISMSASIGRHILKGYSIALRASYRRYHQLQAVAFVNPAGANTAEFHMTGLGTTYARFTGTGTFTDVRYRGNGFSVSAQLLPHRREGLSATIMYESFTSSRHLVNQNEVPYTELTSQELKGVLAYISQLRHVRYGAKLEAGYGLRQGSEAIVPSVISSGVENIPTLTLYRNRLPYAHLRGILEWNDGSGKVWSIEPTTGAQMSDAIRRESSNRMKIYEINGGGTASLTAMSGKFTTLIRLSCIYTARPTGILKLPASIEPFLYNRYSDIYEYYTQDMTSIGIYSKLLYSAGKMHPYLSPDISFRHWGSDGSAVLLSIAAGIEF